MDHYTKNGILANIDGPCNDYLYLFITSLASASNLNKFEATLNEHGYQPWFSLYPYVHWVPKVPERVFKHLPRDPEYVYAEKKQLG